MPEPGRQHLQRVPPHDLATEVNLLGAAMLNPAAAKVVAELEPVVFYKPSNGHVADVITQLVGEEAVTDPGTVAAVLRQRGLLDAVGGAKALVSMQAGCPSTTAAPKWAEMLATYARKRQLLGLLGEAVEAVYSGVDLGGLVAEMHATVEEQVSATASSWEPVNLAAVLAGEGEQLEPTMLARTDGACLLYPGRIHAFNAESESGKSWLAMAACVEQIAAGAHVLYVDFEDAAESVVERLLALGVRPETLLERFHYVRPDDPIDAGAKVRIAGAVEAWHPTLAVLDGVTEAMVVSGWSIKDNDDAARFLASLPRQLERAGVAVLLIDHVTKDRETRGSHAIGAQHKRAGITGASFSLDVIRPFGRGLHGVARLGVTKDKHGRVRAAAVGGRLAGELHLRPTDGGTGLRCEVLAPTVTNGEFRPTGYMERVSRALEGLPEPISTNDLVKVVRGRKDVVLSALGVLITEGRVGSEKGPRKSQMVWSIKPFRESDERADEHEDGVRDEPF